MVSFAGIDIFIILTFFTAIILIGLYAAEKNKNSAEDYLLSGRNVGLFLFVLTNVSTWYGGILGVGEFTYRYGLLSWFTQGLPYYIFAVLFAFLFAEKIRMASLFTIPDKIKKEYGNTAGILSAVIVFILVSPAPYILMTANLISLVFNINILLSLTISLLISMVYLIRGGYRSDLYTDALQFFVMFAAFIIILVSAYNYNGGIDFLENNLPSSHLKFTGEASPFFIIVWFLIALWTFADPGFHQRCYAAKSGKTAKKGILISILFWALFDFLTTGTGLYARAALPENINPVLSFPLLAEKILSPGFKGIFYAGLFATIMSTLNSFLFLSASTLGRDFFFNLTGNKNESVIKNYTMLGLLVSGIVAVIIAYLIPSVIQIWYTIGSVFIPGIILPVAGAYYEKIRISSKLTVIEICVSAAASLVWFIIRDLTKLLTTESEPMLAGLAASLIIHTYGIIKKADKKFYQLNKKN